MKKTKKALASLAIAGMTLSMIPFNVFAASPVTRIAGVTAEQTAVQIAEQTGYTGTAILASSTSYGMVDALTAGPLAASLKAPILLTGAGSSLDAATKAELTKLAVKKVYVTSGTAVIKQSVIDELKGMGIEVVALGGFDRAETSVNIAKKMTGVTKVAVANTVVDALSIAAVASAANQPILLTDRDALPASVAAYLASAGVTASDVIGGTGVISDAVKAGLPSATRHAGMSAYDTNNQVIQDFASSLKFDTVYVANGVTGIDALAGAPLAAQTQSPIVLTDGKSVPAAAKFTYDKSPVGAVVTALGGEFVVPESVRAGVAAGAVTPDSNELKIVSISALNDANSVLQITFSKPVTSLDRGDVTIQNAKTLARYGVEEANLLSGGTMAEIKLYETVEGQKVLQSNTQYNVTVKANGTPLTGIFNRSAWVEAAVTAVSSADKEIEVAGMTLKVVDDKFDYQGALGRTARVWFNQDKEITNIAYDDQEVVKYDAVEITDTDEIKLISEDEKYDVADEDFLIYDDGDNINDTATVDGDTVLVNEIDLVEAPKGTKYDFAKVVLNDNGDVQFVSLNNWEDYLVVDSVEEDIVVGVDGSGEFDAEDAVIVKDGKEVALSGIKAGDILYFSNSARGNDGFAEVLKNTVTGEIETVYEDSIEVDGETYDYINASSLFGDADYINDDGEVAPIDEDTKAEELQAAGEVTLNFDRKGDLVFVGGDTAEVESNSYFGYVEEASDLVAYLQAGKEHIDITLVDENEDSKSYDLVLEDLDTISFNAEEYDVDTTPEAGDVNPTLTGQVGTSDIYDTLTLVGNAGNIGTVDVDSFTGAVEVSLNDDGDVVGIGFYTNAAAIGSAVESGDKYAAGKLLSDSTVIIELNNAGDEVDNVYKWGDLDGYKITAGDVYFDEDNEADAIVVTTNDAENVENKKAFVTDVRRVDGDLTKITAFIGGEELVLVANELTDANADALEEGDVALLKMNEDTNEVMSVLEVNDTDYVKQNRTIDANGVNVGNRELDLSDGFTYKLESGGVVIDATDLDDVEVVPFTDLNSLEANERVTVVLGADNTLFAKTFIITDIADSNQGPTVAAPLADDTASVAGGNNTYNLAGVFADADGDSLTYTVTSSAPAFATVSVTAGVVTLVPVAAGTTTITVTANDGNGGTISDSFDVVVGL